jgi:predicted lipoprotein with Yx(FWY)xxD motif
MTRSIRYSAGVALAIGALALAGCGDDDDGGGGAAASAGIVSVANVDGNQVLADSHGRTLYSAAAEEGGKILCIDACTSFWKPVVASPGDAHRAAEALGADLSLLKRPDGEKQLTFDGLPLYTFAEEDAGQLEGDGFVDDFQGTHFEWQAARTDGGDGSKPQESGGGGYGY